jgi:hypothetical protein
MNYSAPADEIIVYTCVSKNYDRKLMAVEPRQGLRFVAFTDDPKGLDAPGWEMRAIESPKRLTSGHDINRFHKLFPHRLFPEHRWSIYIDGNLTYRGDFAELVRQMDGTGAAVGGFWQPHGRTLGEEADANRLRRFDAHDLKVVEAQLAAYAAAGVGPERKIPTNHLMVRDHHAPGFAVAMSIWWSQLFEFTKRDQMSLIYALDQAGAHWVCLATEDGTISHDLVEIAFHKPPLAERAKRKLKRKLNIR